jgi:hypothetical protein
MQIGQYSAADPDDPNHPDRRHRNELETLKEEKDVVKDVVKERD